MHRPAFRGLPLPGTPPSRVDAAQGTGRPPWTRRGLLVLAVAVLAGGMSPARAHAADDTLEGIVRTLATDTVESSANAPVFSGQSKDVYRQVLDVGKRFYFLRGHKFRPNTRVKVRGQISGDSVDVASTTTLGTVAGMPSSGTTRVLVMLASWTSPDSATPAAMHEQMFSDSNGWYREASYQGLGQTGDVTPWLTVPAPVSGCYANSGTLMSNAKAAAERAGYDLASYGNFVLYFPNCAGDAAGYAGWAVVDGPNTWLNGYRNRRVTVHEQGHNYGLYHSHARMCAGGDLSGTCSFEDYGDPYDVMGTAGNSGHFNASQKSVLGWGTARTIDLSTGGTATLSPMSSASTAINSAVVAMPTGRRYWVEYRQPTGFDSGLFSSGTDGVLVHVSGSGSGVTRVDDTGASLIDVRPSDGISQYSATLPSGQAWNSDDGVTFSVGTVSPLGATVTVTKGVTSYPVAVTRAGSGSGTVTSSPAGISCGLTCSARFASGSPVTLTAAAAAGSSFTGWSGACTGAALTCTVTPTSAQSVTATFAVSSVTVNDATVGTTNNTFAYSGTWGVSKGTAKYLGDDHWSATTGSSYTLRFTGTQVKLYGAKAPHHGKASVSVNGGSSTTIDLYSSTRQDNVLIYQSAVLGSQAHTVKVTVTGTKNASSSGYGISVDRAVVSTPTLVAVNDAVLGSAPDAFSYAGTWRTSTGSTTKYLGDDHWSYTTGSSYTFRFTGTQVALYGAKASSHGQATVSVDGGTSTTIDQYASTRQENVLVYRSPVLAAGSHTVKVTVKGTKNASSTNFTIAVDRAVATR
jgi:hypothetical protein